MTLDLLEYFSRREFITDLSEKIGLTMVAISSSVVNGTSAVPDQKAESASKQDMDRKLGIALVGLGKYSEEQLAPALQETQHCKLAGIVTGTPDKIDKWKRKYNIPDRNVYNYQNFDTIKDNADIDIVYVVLPNAMHAEYTVRAAKAGKHVICEKPMAVSVKECDEMIKACQDADRLLSIGYRLHFEPYNMAMMELGKKKTHGAIRVITAKNGMEIEPGVWRLDKALAGGGPLMDVGIYCVQGALYTMGENPVAVTAKEGAKTDTKKFSEVEESISWELEFANGAVAKSETSYAKEMNLLRADAEHGWFELKPAYPYEGIKGETSQGKMNLPEVTQQALQMDDFAKCVKGKTPSKVPGEMGLRDVKILMAIYEAAKTGNKVALKF